MKAGNPTPALAAAVAGILALASCGGGPEPRPEPRLGTDSGARFELALEAGPHYAKDMRILWIAYTVWPQVAVWLEDESGRYIDTLYVTELAVSHRFRAAPKEGRPEALPVWSHLPKGTVDAVSSPTTVGAPVRYGNGLAAGLPSGRYVVKLETNRSYDWNGTYTKKNSGVNGQPSLVYEARLQVGGEAEKASFVPVGHGSVDGSDGLVRPGLEGIDTALQLFSAMGVSYLPR